ncbi:MAG: hypothetical protein ACLFVU_07665 [Phycisphaerae bacterium]
MPKNKRRKHQTKQPPEQPGKRFSVPLLLVLLLPLLPGCVVMWQTKGTWGALANLLIGGFVAFILVGTLSYGKSPPRSRGTLGPTRIYSRTDHPFHYWYFVALFSTVYTVACGAGWLVTYFPR